MARFHTRAAIVLFPSRGYKRTIDEDHKDTAERYGIETATPHPGK